MMRRLRYWVDELTTREALIFGGKLALGLVVFSAVSKFLFSSAPEHETLVSDEKNASAPVSGAAESTVPLSSSSPEEIGVKGAGRDQAAELFSVTRPVGEREKTDEVAQLSQGVTPTFNPAVVLFGPLGEENPAEVEQSAEVEKKDKLIQSAPVEKAHKNESVNRQEIRDTKPSDDDLPTNPGSGNPAVNQSEKDMNSNATAESGLPGIAGADKPISADTRVDPCK